MPLRAVSGTDDISAFDQDATSWALLKKIYKSSGLKMPCCQNGAIPKTSKLGNFFFAHAAKGECTYAPESAEHIFLKYIIARAAVAAGWRVTTECVGETPNAATWVADVYCEKGTARVALEVQLSYQTSAQMLARHEIYRTSNVRTAWFLSSRTFKSNYLAPRQEIPFFFLPTVVERTEPNVETFGVPLSDFITCLLGGKLRWRNEQPTVEADWLEIIYLDDVCWKCDKAVKQVYGSCIGVYGEHAVTVPNASNILERIQSTVSNACLRRAGLNPIGRFDKIKGNTVKFPYCNVCIHCGAVQNNYYLLQKLAKYRGQHSGAIRVVPYRAQKAERAVGIWELIR